MNDNGIYPHYPHPQTTKLYICQDEIETASILQAKILENRDAVISLRKGEFTPIHQEALKPLTHLKTIMVFGKIPKGLLTISEEHSSFPELIQIELPKDHTLNDFWINYGVEGIAKLIGEQKQVGTSQTSETDVPQAKNPELFAESNKTPEKKPFQVLSHSEFQYQGKELFYEITGIISPNPTLLTFDFTISNGHLLVDKLSTTLNLLNPSEYKYILFNWTENKPINYANALIEIETIKKHLENERREQIKTQKQSQGLNTNLILKAKAVLQSQNLFEDIQTLIEQSGIIGNHSSRLLLYLIASSYKFAYNLHAVIQTQSMPTAGELIQKIAQLIPETDRYEIDLTTAKTFRYYGNTVLHQKLLVIPDYSGITSTKAIYDLKRLQAKDAIINDAPKKSITGHLHTIKQEIKGHTASIGASTQTKKYFEHQEKTISVKIDTSDQQIQKLMQYDCQKMAGQIDPQTETNAQQCLRHILNQLHPRTVLNPYAHLLTLPITIPNARILTRQLLSFVNLITLFHQYQRQTDKEGRLITHKQDLILAIDLFLETIIIHADELDASTRNFFEVLKTFSHNQSKNGVFTSLQVREALHLTKTTVNRYLKKLVDYEYLKKEGFKNTGFTYTITNWSNNEMLRNTLKNKLETQLTQTP